MADNQRLEEQVALLELENDFFRKFLTSRGVTINPAPAVATAAHCATPNRLLLVELLELCTVEAQVTRRQVEKVKLSGELELACIQSGIADCRQQDARETRRDVGALLAALGLADQQVSMPSETATSPQSTTAEPATPTPATVVEPATPETQQPGDNSAAASTDTVCQLEAAATSAAPAPTSKPALHLLSARQLEKAELNGSAVQKALESILARHDTAAARLEYRNTMVQSQLRRVEGQLAAKEAAGGDFVLRKVDFETLRIEKAQAEEEVAAATAGNITLKSQVVAAQQQLANQRSLLASTVSEAVQLRQQIAVRQGQGEQQLSDAAKLRRECEGLERECQQLREHGKGKPGTQGGGHTVSSEGEPKGLALAALSAGAAAGEHGGTSTDDGRGSGEATILGYMRVKNACAEMSKKISDWQRKLKVQSGRRRAECG